MTNEEAREWVDIARMGYICDPQECGLEKGKDPCKVFHCDEIHNALVMAIEALEKQAHSCGDCRHADYVSDKAIYCLKYSCVMAIDNGYSVYCRTLAYTRYKFST